MRARNLKSEFFRDEKVIEVSFGARLLFMGLWCFADREGRFLWKERQMKIDIFPDQDVDIPAMLAELLAGKLILKYGVDGIPYGYIPHFLDHQKPHPHEAKSSIPEYNQCHDMSLQNVNTNVSLILGMRNDDIRNDNIKEYADATPFQIPSKEEISESAIPKVKDDLTKLVEEIYAQKLFPKIHAFKNQMLKKGVNPRTIIHALTRCYVKRPPPDEAWGYCLQIIKVEDGNYNERDSTKAM